MLFLTLNIHRYRRYAAQNPTCSALAGGAYKWAAVCEAWNSTASCPFKIVFSLWLETGGVRKVGCQVFPGGAVIHLPQQQTPTSTWCWRAQLGVARERVRKNIKASMAIERGHCDHEKSKKQKKKEEKGKSGLATEAKERGHCDQGKSKEKKKRDEKGKSGRATGAKERGHCGRTKGWTCPRAGAWRTLPFWLAGGPRTCLLKICFGPYGVFISWPVSLCCNLGVRGAKDVGIPA